MQPAERTVKPPRVSVVVPFYNVERYIASCVDGLLHQSVPATDYEIVLVDNGSTDRSLEIARSFRGVTVLQQSVPGSYAARNLGITNTRGPIIAMIDPDCRPAPSWLEAILESTQDPACGIVLGYPRHGTESSALGLLAAYEAEKIEYVTHRKVSELYFGYTNNMAVRREVFDKVGLFPERMRGGDTMFVQRAVDRLGCEIVRYNPRMEVTHLEINSVGDYYRKRTIYGQSNERLSQSLSFRPLRNRERFKVFRDLVRKRRLRPGKALLLLALLAPGAFLYEAGRQKAKLKGSESRS